MRSSGVGPRPFAAALTCLTLLILLLGTATARAQTELRFAAGPEDGTYRLLGAAVKRAVESKYPKLKLRILTTQGSPENVTLLENDKADFALVQSDVLGPSLQAGGVAGQTAPGVRLVAALFQEPVQVVVGRTIKDNALSSLDGRPVALGHRGGGTLFSARAILDILGVSYTDVPVASASDVCDALMAGRAHAGFFVSNAPTPQVALLLTDPKFRVLSLSTPEMSQIQKMCGYYLPVEIAAHTYPHQPVAVHTISVLNLLVCRSALPAGQVRAVAEAVMRDVQSPRSHLRKARSDMDLPSLLRLTSRTSLGLHNGSEAALKSVPVAARFANYLQWIVWAVAVLGLGACLAISCNRPARVRGMNIVRRCLPPRAGRVLRPLLFNRLLWHVTRATSVMMLVWLLGAAFMYSRESEVNVSFTDLKTSALSIVVYLFSGLEDRPPVTDAGWIGSVVMLVVGLFMAAFITGKFASEILLHTSGVIQMTKDIARDSMLIIGWSSRAERVVKELFAAWEENIEEGSITVLTELKVDPARYPEFDSRGVTFISGNTCDKKVLERVGAARARCIFVLAEDRADGKPEQAADADARSALVVLALRSLLDANTLRRPRICVEVMNHRKMDLIRDAGGDEIVCHEDYGLGVLTQSAFAPEIADVYQQLLTYSEDTCEVYILVSPRDGVEPDIPGEVWSGVFEGKSFSEASQAFAPDSDSENPAILIGVRREGAVILNPRRLTIKQGDDLVVISYSRPRRSALRALLKA